MPTPIADAQEGFAGGLNTVSDPAFLLPNQAFQLTNSRLTKFGAAIRRGGLQYVAASSLAITPRRGLYWPKNSLLIYGGNSTAVYSISPAVGSAATALGGSVLAQSRLLDQCVFSDGTNEVMYLASADLQNYPSITVTALQRTNTGATTVSAALAGVPTTISGLCVYNSRLWGWNTGLTNVLYYSNLSTAGGSIGGDSLGVGASSGGSIIVTTFGFSAIVACQPVGSSLLIFHQRGISRLTGFGQSDTTVQPQSISPDVSLWGRMAIDTYNGVAWFMTPRGLYRATENQVAPVGTPEKPDPTAVYLPTVAVTNNNDPPLLVRFNRATSEVWVVIPNYVANSQTAVFIYDTLLEAWSGPFTGSGSEPSYGSLLSLVEVVDQYNFPHLWLSTFSGSSPGTNWMQCDASGYTDRILSNGTAGSGYTQTLQCHRMFGQGVPQTYRKSFETADVLATLATGATASMVTATTTGGGNSTTTMAVSTATVQAAYTNAVGGTGPYVDITITDTATSASQYARVEVAGTLIGR